VGKRHDLPQINIFTPDARLNEVVPERLRGETATFDIKAGKQVINLADDARVIEPAYVADAYPLQHADRPATGPAAENGPEKRFQPPAG
jgi:hypothetical protein